MLEDCRSGKIDLIIVKSVSRFARNQLDFISIYRELKTLPNPVGIYIEDINLNTLDINSEFILSLLVFERKIIRNNALRFCKRGIMIL